MLAMNGKVMLTYLPHLCWIISCCLITVLRLNTAQDITDNVLLLSTFQALDKLLEFFRKNYQQMTVDTVFGLRVIEGQCKLLTEEYDKKQLEFIALPVIDEIRRLGVEAGKLANMAIPHIVDQDKEHFGLMKQVIVGPWKVFHTHRVVNPSLRWDAPPNPPAFSETDSDHCLGELMGGPSANVTPCKVTEKCLKSMLSPGQLGYELHRQIFYTIIARKMSCEQQINDYLVARTSYKNVGQVQHEFCSNAYYDIDETISTHGLNPAIRDRFLEAEFLCPSLGYFQFMRSDWLDAIVSWQSEKGCFPGMAHKIDVPTAQASSRNGSAFATNNLAGDSAAAFHQSNQHAVLQSLSNHLNIPLPIKPHSSEATIQSTTSSDQLFDAIPQQWADPKQLIHDLSIHKSPKWIAVASPSSPLKYAHSMQGNDKIIQSDQHERANVNSHLLAEPPDHHAAVQNFAAPHLEKQQLNAEAIGLAQNQGIHGGLQSFGPHNAHLYIPLGAVAYSMPSLRTNAHPDVNSLHQQHQQLQQQQQFVWHNDIAYTVNDEPHNQNLPLVVPHHSEDEYESAGQAVEPRHPPAVVKKYPRQVQEPRRLNSDNPFVLQYRLNRGLKSVDMMSSDHISPLKMPLHEKRLTGDCYSHLTAMASATLAMYLRYLVDPGPPEFTHLRLGNQLRRNAAYKLKTAAAVHSPSHVAISSSDSRLHVKINPAFSVVQLPPPVQGDNSMAAAVPQINNSPDNVRAHHNSLMNDVHEHSNGQYSHVDKPSPDLNDMKSRAYNFMGMYQRRWGPQFQPIYAGSNYGQKNSEGAQDYIHKAVVPKDLPDWTVSYSSSSSKEAIILTTPSTSFGQDIKVESLEVHTISTAPTWRRYKDVQQSVHGQVRGPDVGLKPPMQVRIEIHSPLQGDLDHYLIAVTIISVLCLFILFRYFRQRRGLSRGKTRNI